MNILRFKRYMSPEHTKDIAQFAVRSDHIIAAYEYGSGVRMRIVDGDPIGFVFLAENIEDVLTLWRIAEGVRVMSQKDADPTQNYLASDRDISPPEPYKEF